MLFCCRQRPEHLQSQHRLRLITDLPVPKATSYYYAKLSSPLYSPRKQCRPVCSVPTNNIALGGDYVHVFQRHVVSVAGNRYFTTLKSTTRISLSFFGTEQLPPWPEPN